jgi:O-antigen/teichoic acid export membrane protein
MEKKSFLVKILVALVTKFLGAVLSYLMFLVIARFLATKSYGEFTYYFSVASILAVLISMGQPRIIMRFVGVNETKTIGNVVTELEIFSSSFLMLIMALVITCSFFIFGEKITGIEQLDASAMYLVFMICGLGVITAFSQFYSHILRSLGSTWGALVPREVIWRILVIGVIFFGLAPTNVVGLLMLVNGLFFLILTVQFFLIYIRKEKGLDVGGVGKYISYFIANARVKIKSSIWLTLSGLSGPALQYVFVFIVALYLTTEVSGGFFTVFKTASLMGLPLVAGNLVAAPLIAKAYSVKDFAQLKWICKLESISTGLVSGLSLVGFYFYGYRILHQFDESYIVYQTELLTIGTGFLVSSLCGPTSYFLTMTGHERINTLVVLFSGSLGICLSLFLIPLWGTFGAAISFLATIVGQNLAIVAYSKIKLDINTTAFQFTR